LQVKPDRELSAKKVDGALRKKVGRGEQGNRAEEAD
jgi:hypothetical protein